MSVALWYYVENGASIGPVQAIDIDRLIGLATITRDTLVWQEGMQDWMAAEQHFSFASAPPTPVNQRGVVQGAPSGGTRRPPGLNAAAPQCSFGEAIRVCFLKYVGFSGWASRSEFWYFVLFTFIGSSVAGGIDGALFPYNELTPISSLFSLTVLLPLIAVSIRRMHDINRVGWWILLPLVNVAFYCLKGQSEPNRYG
ncbi:hypothetical protein DUF85 [Octadecabacter antarcticus 307]|uniref:GYF domain-containing protein n=1 Tax=Octadecabacter antarcticus 307 TaxID=391626 RepID=M9RDU0_9RHOB|nr:DUF805 domain-containing protein [Octadecabacter antarcticus]AGI67950.1 hypothetical protein DUF85 [Octadecabacter antarcticus 307]